MHWIAVSKISLLFSAWSVNQSEQQQQPSDSAEAQRDLLQQTDPSSQGKGTGAMLRRRIDLSCPAHSGRDFHSNLSAL